MLNVSHKSLHNAQDKLRIKKNVMCKRLQSQNQNNFFNSNNIRLYSTSFRGVLRTHSNIYNGVFWEKSLNIFTKKLHRRYSTVF